MEIEHSYINLKIESTDGSGPDLIASEEPGLLLPASSNQHAYLFDDLEDEDLQFKGYCYTTTGPAEAREASFACDYCPAIFDTRVGLTNHAKLHGAEKKIKCELCNFACTNKKTMRVHKRNHGIVLVRGRRAGTGPKQKLKKMAEAQKSSRINDVVSSPPSIEKEDPMQMRQQPTEPQSPLVEQGEEGEDKAIVEENDEKTPPPKLRRSSRKRTTSKLEKTQNKRGNGSGADKQIREVRISELPVKEEPAKRSRRTIKQEKHGKKMAQPPNQRSPKENMKKRSQKQRKAGSPNSSNSGGNAEIGSSIELGCAVCPYRTNHLHNLDLHMLNHSRPSGYVCSVCHFKHEHKRWLQQHCLLHEAEGIHAQWPPEYIYGEERMTNANEKRTDFAATPPNSAAKLAALVMSPE